MQLTIRMPDEHYRKMATIAKKMGLKKSDIARMAVKRFVEEYGETIDAKSSYEKSKHLLGVAASGMPDLGKKHRQHLIDKIKMIG